jgi:hypothetical protein
MTHIFDIIIDSIIDIELYRHRKFTHNIKHMRYAEKYSVFTFSECSIHGRVIKQKSFPTVNFF